MNSPSTAAENYFDLAFHARPVMALFRGLSPAETVRACTSVWDAGVTVVEIPLSSATGTAALEAAVAAARPRGLTVGAGTITSMGRLHDAVQAGAAFTVAPGWDLDIARESVTLGLPHLPGVASASDITAAQRAGFRWLKAFPASVLGPGWIRAMRGPFPDIDFVATGGVTPESAPEFLHAGCSAVALGQALATSGAAEAIGSLRRVSQRSK